MKTKLSNSYNLFILTSIVVLLFVGGCKKDQLIVNEEKEYLQIDHVQMDPLIGGWRLTIKPDGTADIIPSGDIIYRGTYNIKGSEINVKTPQNLGSYTFKIISETEIKEKEYGVRLGLKLKIGK